MQDREKATVYLCGGPKMKISVSMLPFGSRVVEGCCCGLYKRQSNHIYEVFTVCTHTECHSAVFRLKISLAFVIKSGGSTEPTTHSTSTTVKRGKF